MSLFFFKKTKISVLGFPAKPWKMLREGPVQLPPVGSRETHESHPAAGRAATWSQQPDLCVPMQLHTWDSLLWSKCLLRAQQLLHVETKATPQLFQMIPCLHDFQTPH